MDCEAEFEEWKIKTREQIKFLEGFFKTLGSLELFNQFTATCFMAGFVVGVTKIVDRKINE